MIGFSARGLSFAMLHCRTRLLPSGSKERLWFAQQVFFILAIRGVQTFAPYRRIGLRAAQPPSPSQPTRPLLRDDPDDVRQIAAAFATAFLDRYKPKPGCLPDRVLNHPSTHPGPRRELVHAPIALPVLADLVADNPEHGQLTDRKLASQGRWHRTRGGEVATPSNRDRALRSPLQPPGWEERGSAGWNAHRLDLAAQDTPAGMQELG
jgi:hypothetical protein